ncbi:major facilitator superfamily domain-containing protein [Plectosphaerella cucumerina]|uniref:Major facilitator superfamily domain-containing protein n=1 Tax=Plectosphaerella cucumerina TaxID=40658 RepID=A0A8K0TM93_9PEZI|nr:major facilitator superfamily domain-containing protein [Plectosphaerella cucumerina]
MRYPDQTSPNAIAVEVDSERATPLHVPEQPNTHSMPDPDAHLPQAEKDKNARHLLWQLDLKLLPWLCILYLLAFLDRANIGNAKIAGLSSDLGLTTAQFNATLTIFFVSYAKLKPSISIPILMIAWGGVMTGMGFVKNWSSLMAARRFLGLAEAGLFPGISLYLSCWYKSSELGLRTAFFFSAAAIAGSFGESLSTVIFGVASFWAVYDFPDDPNTTFLSPEDKARAIKRLKEDHQASAKHNFSMNFFYQALRDWKMWLAMIIYSGCTIPLYAFSMFLPTIIHDLGWSTSVVQYARRGIFNVGCSIIALVGFIMQLASRSPAVKYSGTFLAALGIYPCTPNTKSWISNNTEGVYKRGVVLGFVIGWGNLNGVVSSNIYFSGPKHVEGQVVIGYLGVFVLGGSLCMMALLRNENSKRRRGVRDAWVAGRSEEEVNALGDQRPDFIYAM